jgi:hypothetical protein
MKTIMNPKLQDAYDLVSSRCEGYGPQMDEAVGLVFDALADGAYETGRKEGIEEAAQLFELHNSFAWLCMDHGGEEAEKICKMIRGLLK